MVEHLFVDTTFLVARFNRQDRKHSATMEVLRAQREPGLPAYRLVLIDYVFEETVTTLLYRSGRHGVAARAGEALRGPRALGMLHVVAGVLDAAWALFLDRKDKRGSFTDCTAFVLMGNLGIRKAVTFDANFRQAGFATFP